MHGCRIPSFFCFEEVSSFFSLDLKTSYPVDTQPILKSNNCFISVESPIPPSMSYLCAPLGSSGQVVVLDILVIRKTRSIFVSPLVFPEFRLNTGADSLSISFSVGLFYLEPLSGSFSILKQNQNEGKTPFELNSRLLSSRARGLNSFCVKVNALN